MTVGGVTWFHAPVYEHVVCSHLGSVRSEPHYGVGELCVHPDGGAEVGLGQGGLHLGQQQGKLLRDQLLPYGTAVRHTQNNKPGPGGAPHTPWSW